MSDRSNDSRARLAELAGVTPDTEHARLAADIIARCRLARDHNNGHPKGVWSTGEQLAVAVVLDDREHLTEMDYTFDDAVQRVADGMYFPPADPTAWLLSLRTQL